MVLRVVPGTANQPLAAAVAARLGTELTQCEVTRFPDGELRPVVAEVRGDDVYVVQPTGPPVDRHLMELFLLLDACRRGGPDRVTAVLPYYGYARQDRRARAGEAVGARVVADLLGAARADRLLVIDPHTVALEAMCPMPVEMLTAVPTLADRVRPMLDDEAVVVAPDLGAVKLAERYATFLHRSVAVVRKTRVSGATVEVHGLVGDVAGRPTLIVDDMISTGSTIEAAMNVIVAQGGVADLVVATHGVLANGATERMNAAGMRRLLLTDTLVTPDAPPAEVCTIAPLLADAMSRLHRNEPLEDLLIHT